MEENRIMYIAVMGNYEFHRNSPELDEEFLEKHFNLEPSNEFYKWIRTIDLDNVKEGDDRVCSVVTSCNSAEDLFEYVTEECDYEIDSNCYFVWVDHPEVDFD